MSTKICCLKQVLLGCQDYPQNIKIISQNKIIIPSFLIYGLLPQKIFLWPDQNI